MKVLVQYWIGRGAEILSLSKDKEQLLETIARVERVEEEGTLSDGEEVEITIPDDHYLAEAVESETIFLHSDEMSIVWDSPEYQTQPLCTRSA